ncbi:mucin-3A-like [Struthio camelus]|uniref:mucin-3A-like n=1 Tax=Struthio camelus TaxID=8801 RepID=UPI0036042E8F
MSSTTASTTEVTSTAIIPPVICWNGGTYDGIKCICTAYFYGPVCEFSTDYIDTSLPYPGTIVMESELVLTVTNFNYTEELNNTLSEAYRKFEEHFRTEIKKIYGHIPGYEGVRIIRLRPGSVVVEHEVIFTALVSNNTVEHFQEVTERLVQMLRDTEANQGACQHNTSILCLSVSPNPVLKNMTETSSLEEICWQRAPNEYRDFYYPLTVDGFIRCITACTPNTPNTTNCHHGQCHVTRAGPQCFCQDESMYWYTGTNCSQRVNKLGMGLGLAATVLLIVCIVLTVLLVRGRRRKYNVSEAHSDVRDSWYEEDSVTWYSSDGLMYQNQGATNFTGGDTCRSFQPSLDMVDTSVPTHIMRPTLVTKL